MAESIGLWAVRDGAQRVNAGAIDRERRLEEWIESHPDVLGERLLRIGGKSARRSAVSSISSRSTAKAAAS